MLATTNAKPKAEDNKTHTDVPAVKNRLLTNEGAAAYIGVTARTLEVWRCTKRHNITYIKVGRLVKYRQAALDAFLAANTVEA